LRPEGTHTEGADCKGADEAEVTYQEGQTNLQQAEFLLRGIRKVQCEWSLICATKNLLRLFAAGGLALITLDSGGSIG